MAEKKTAGGRKLPVMNPQGTDGEMLGELCRVTFKYFLKEVDHHTGLIADKTKARWPSSIAAVGLGLSTYIVAVERNFLSRNQAVRRVLKVLRFFHASPQGLQADATGYKGFYYHFLHIRSGRRAWNCELSTIDTAILIAGALTAASYFDRDNSAETEIRQLADSLYRRVDWRWALDGKKTITHGWKPESGFLPYRWAAGYCEAHILYILALGSPTFAIDPAGYHEWTSTFQWKTFYGTEMLYAGPLFIHQLSQIWLDCRGIRDAANCRAGIDYFENSRRATHVQRKYAIENPLGFAHYSAFAWGFTASDGPGPAVRDINDVRREFYGYMARGAPLGPDDGTISPWAVAASLPFAPEIVVDTLRHAIERLDLVRQSAYGFDASFNPTYPESRNRKPGWISPWIFALNQGPIVLMIANYESELIWNTVRKCVHIGEGLRRAGFRGGWLDKEF
ncbi:MAG: glucoamylase family protein [Nitrospirota bacterium]